MRNDGTPAVAKLSTAMREGLTIGARECVALLSVEFALGLGRVGFS